jgi:class 3 adenylate cyclase
VTPGSGLPSGTVTFLFTDIEGSTELLKRLGRDVYESVLAEHSGIVRAAVAEYDGWVVDTQGDSLFCAFRSAREGVSAAVEAQRGLESRGWPEHVRVRVRMGLHSGEPKAGEERYVGIGVHRAARIGAAAHGGQILISQTTRALVADDLPARVSLRDLGVHRLKDIDEPERLYQVVAPDLQEAFPPLRTVRRGRSRRARLALVAAALAIVGGAVAGGLLATGSSSAKPVPLVANSLAVLDTKTGKPVGDLPLGFTPTDVAAGGERIWVLNAVARTATAIDPSTLRVVQTVGAHGAPDSQYAVGGKDWIAFPGGVDEVDSTGATKIALWRPDDLARCFAYVTGHGRTVWVSEGQNFAELDAANGSVLRKLRLPAEKGIPPGTTCYGLRYTGGQLLAIRNTDYSMGPVDPRSGSYTPAVTDIALNASTFFSANWAAGFGSYWIGTYRVKTNTLGQTNVLARLDSAVGQVTEQIPVAGYGQTVLVDPATGVWALGNNSHLVVAALLHVDPTSDETWTIRFDHRVCCPNGAVGNGVSLGHGRLWVGLGSP